MQPISQDRRPGATFICELDRLVQAQSAVNKLSEDTVIPNRTTTEGVTDIMRGCLKQACDTYAKLYPVASPWTQTGLRRT